MIGVEPGFKLQEFFILFVVFYYALLGIRMRRSRYFIAATILFPVTLGASGRGMLVAVVLTLLFFFVFVFGPRETAPASITFSAIPSVPFLLAYSLSPALLPTPTKRFSHAFRAATV